MATDEIGNPLNAWKRAPLDEVIDVNPHRNLIQGTDTRLFQWTPYRQIHHLHVILNDVRGAIQAEAGLGMATFYLLE